MKNMNYIKKTYIVLFVLLAVGLILFRYDIAEARDNNRSGSHHRSSSQRPAGGHKDNNSYAKDSKSGRCKKVRGHCVTFSKGGCGNFYIDGYHYGGSKACKILGRCSNPRVGATPINLGGTNRTLVNRTVLASSTYSTSTLTSVLTRSCTPGAAVNGCPADTLGDIMTNFYLNPSYGNSKTNTCPLFWTPGRETADAKIVCMIESNGVETEVPTDPKAEGFPDGFPVQPGKFKLSCTRVLTLNITDASGTHQESVETEQSANFNCRPYPRIREI